MSGGVGFARAADGSSDGKTDTRCPRRRSPRINCRLMIEKLLSRRRFPAKKILTGRSSPRTGNRDAAAPRPESAAFGDDHPAVLPAYAIWRVLGAPYDTAFQLWCMTVLSLDFAAFWLFLRRAPGASPLAAGFGAFLFAFGAPRVNQIGHEQLFAQ